MEDREQLAVDPLESMSLAKLDKSTYVSSLLSGAEKEQIREVMLHNMDVFTWTHLDMVGINLIHTSHKLNVIPSARLVRQEIRHFHLDRYQVIQLEVNNLLDFGRGIHQRDRVPGMAGQCSGSPEKRRKMESVHGLHES